MVRVLALILILTLSGSYLRHSYALRASLGTVCSILRLVRTTRMPLVLFVAFYVLYVRLVSRWYCLRPLTSRTYPLYYSMSDVCVSPAAVRCARGLRACCYS